jgi:hypothetical protein
VKAPDIYLPGDEDPVPLQDQQTPADVLLVTQSTLARKTLADDMPPETYEAVVTESLSFIERRFASMQETRVVSEKNNLNPFLMLLMAPAYNVFSPFEVAEYLQNAKMPHGDATAFGKFVETNIFPLFGVTSPLEKATDKEVYSPIDAEITVDGTRYLTSWKSGPWTMNQSHANEMLARFPNIHTQTGCDIVLGIIYGTEKQLNNKPALVRRGTGEYVHVLVGAELWEFVTGVRNAHMKILDAIREAQGRFAIAHGGKTFYEHMIEARLALAESFRKEFELTGESEDMWAQLFERAF